MICKKILQVENYMQKFWEDPYGMFVYIWDDPLNVQQLMITFEMTLNYFDMAPWAQKVLLRWPLIES